MIDIDCTIGTKPSASLSQPFGASFNTKGLSRTATQGRCTLRSCPCPSGTFKACQTSAPNEDVDSHNSGGKFCTIPPNANASTTPGSTQPVSLETCPCDDVVNFASCPSSERAINQICDVRLQ